MNQAKTISALLLALGSSSTLAQWTLNPIWSLSPGDRSYIPAAPGDNNQRGMDYNPATGHVLISDRTGGTFIHIISAATGGDLGTMNTTGIAGGTFVLNLLGVADDGAIYGANLTTDSASGSPGPIKVYRWANEAATPTLVYSGDPSGGDASTTNRRFGDTMDVRGSGTSTQILLGSRNGTVAGILTTADGVNFTANKVNNSDSATAGGLGIGVAFGTGNTLYGDALGSVQPRQMSFDLSAGTMTTTATYAAVAAAVGPIAVDASHGLLAGISLNATGTKDTLVLYDISSGTAVLQDTKSFPQDVANANGVGAVTFGGGNVYALDVNNGVMAFSVVPEPGTMALGAMGLGALFAAARRRK